MKTKKIIQWLALLLCLLAIVPTTAIAQGTKTKYSGGSGTKEDPWIIATAEDLNAMGNESKGNNKFFAGEYFKQTADIDMKKYPKFEGIYGLKRTTHYRHDAGFAGRYDGGGHVISNMTIDRPKNYCVGLFGEISYTEDIEGDIGAIVHDVHLDSSCKIIGRGQVGGIVGFLYGGKNSTTSVYNCTSGASVSGTHKVGGIVGDIMRSRDDYQGANLSVWHCLNYGSVTKTKDLEDAAGVVGNISTGGQIIECMNLGTIYAPQTIEVGGVTGFYGPLGKLISGAVNCVNYGYVRGARSTGGGVGLVRSGHAADFEHGSFLLHCLNVGAVTSNDPYVGNIVGKTYGANNANIGKIKMLSVGNVYDKQEYTLRPIATTTGDTIKDVGCETYYGGVNAQTTKSLVSGEVIDGLERGEPSLDELLSDTYYDVAYHSNVFKLKVAELKCEGYSYKKGKYPTLAYWVRENESEKSTFEQSMASSEKAQEECRRILTLIDNARSTYLQFRDEDETSTSHAAPYEDANGVGHIATVYPQDAASITKIVQPKNTPNNLFKIHDDTGKQLDPDYRLEVKQYADTVWLKNGDFEKPVFVKNVLPKRIHLYIKNDANFSYGEEEKATLAPKSVSVKYWTTDIYGNNYQADASAGGSIWPVATSLADLGASDYKENQPYYYATSNNSKKINTVFTRHTPQADGTIALDAGYFLYDALIPASDDQPMTVTVDDTPFTQDLYGTDIVSHSKSIADRADIVSQENAWYLRTGEATHKDKDKDTMITPGDVTLNNVQDGSIKYTYTDKATNNKVTENRTIENKGDVAYITSFSSHWAYKAEKGVEAYVVSGIDLAENDGNATAVVTLTKPMTKDNDGQLINYIPANTGVILVVRSTSDGFADISSRNQEATTTNGYQTSIVQLQPLSGAIPKGYEGVSLLTSNPEGGPYTAPASKDITDDTDVIYPFGFYRKSKVVPTETDASKFLFGFWVASKGQHTIGPNRSYLTLKGAQAKSLGIGTAYDDWDNSSSTTGMANGKPCVLLNFDGGNSGATTAIGNMDADTESSTVGNRSTGWFNLQGQRVNHPTTPGMYIHDGRKVIVKSLTK